MHKALLSEFAPGEAVRLATATPTAVVHPGYGKISAVDDACTRQDASSEVSVVNRTFMVTGPDEAPNLPPGSTLTGHVYPEAHDKPKQRTRSWP